MGDLTRQDSETLRSGAMDDNAQYLTFSVAKEKFAVDILDIREIIELSLMTDVPLAPDFIRGIVNLRGSVLPVVDLAVRLGRGEAVFTKRSCIVVVEVKGERSQNVGVLVDEVNEILEIPPDCIQPPPNFGEEVKTDFIRAMGRVDESFIILLNIDKILSLEDLHQLEQLAKMRSGLGANTEKNNE